MKRKLKITITKIQKQSPARSSPFFRAVCRICEREVEMLTYTESMKILQVASPTLAALIAPGVIHTSETANSDVCVCKESVLILIGKSTAD
jgi:hypothetical protein